MIIPIINLFLQWIWTIEKRWSEQCTRFFFTPQPLMLSLFPSFSPLISLPSSFIMNPSTSSHFYDHFQHKFRTPFLPLFSISSIPSPILYLILTLPSKPGCCYCLGTFLFPCFVSGANAKRVGKSCFCRCLFYPCCCGATSSTVHDVLLGVPNSCCWNCCLHIWCNVCVNTRDSRATKAWIKAGKPKMVPMTAM